MRQLLFILYFIHTASSVRPSGSGEDLRIVRPAGFVKEYDKAQKILEDMREDDLIPEKEGQLEYVEVIIDDDDDDSSDSVEGEDQQTSSHALKQLMRDLAQAISDYADYGDYGSAETGSKQAQKWRKEEKSDDDEMKKIESISPGEFISQQNNLPRLAIDPPRKPIPDFSENKDEKPEEEIVGKDIAIPIMVRETMSEKESILVPWNVSVNVDISHLMLIALSGFLLFWIVQKAFAYYYRPRPSFVISPIATAEEGSVHKVPLE